MANELALRIPRVSVGARAARAACVSADAADVHDAQHTWDYAKNYLACAGVFWDCVAQLPAATSVFHYANDSRHSPGDSVATAGILRNHAARVSARATYVFPAGVPARLAGTMQRNSHDCGSVSQL
jgi:hypothetical protein